MMSRLKSTVVTSGLMLLSTAAVAHPGHDHGSWESPLIHALFYCSILAIGVAAVARVIKARRNTDK